MIQRIQSVFLVLALVAIGLLFAFPIANVIFQYDGQTIVTPLMLFPKSTPIMESNPEITQGSCVNPIYLVIIASAMALLTFITIFSYKNRILQVRLIAFAMLLNVAFVGLSLLLTIDEFAKNLALYFNTISTVEYSVGTIIPIITIILYWLAQHYIKKDEKLVRSADRLR